MAEIEGLSALLNRLGELALDTHRTEQPLRAAGVLLVASIQKNFQEQGRPQRWTPLAPATIARRRKGKGKGGPKILIDSARLKNSINYKLVVSTGDPAVKVGTNVRYAARQHFGYQGSYSGFRSKTKGKLLGMQRGKSHTPARPFMTVQPEDIDAIARVFKRHIERG